MPVIPPPISVELVGKMVAIRWKDDREDYYEMEQLRKLSPSADNIGEPDIFGNVRGGDPRNEFPGVTVTGYEIVGRYAIRFIFSDGHNTGLFSFEYLRLLGDENS